MGIKKTYLYAGIGVIIILVASVYFLISIFKPAKPQEIPQPIGWKVDSNGYLSYPLDRGNVTFRREDYGVEGNLIMHKIIYQSRNGNVYGLLVLPTTALGLLPGIVLLPGAGVSKEIELNLAKKIAALDAAVLVIDQRGVGETTGKLNTIEQDYADFLRENEPTQHLMVYDALRAYDLMKSAPFTDSGRIALAGESLGGRIAIMAAAIDRNIDGEPQVDAEF